MSTYISSKANRFYTAIEATYGQPATITGTNRFPAVRFHAHQSVQVNRRLDKTGTRTFLGNPSSSRRSTVFEAQTYLTSWNGTNAPSYGPLFEAALGASPTLSTALTIGSTEGALQFQTMTAHGFSVGSGVSHANEIRFVSNVVDGQTFLINAPFTQALVQGDLLAPCISYSLGTALPSLTIYDYWDPTTAVSRMIIGGAVDTLNISINGDFHEFTFSGPAGDLLDSSSFVSGTAGLNAYPSEPELDTFSYSIVPGHLGQVWLGDTASQFFTLTAAGVEIRNNVQMRSQEYGTAYPRAIVGGERSVVSQFTLLAQDDAQTAALYASAKQRDPLAAMLQLGQQQGQLMGVFMPQVVPEIPIYNDAQPRLQWEFNNNVAQGLSNDEIFIAFA